MKNDYPKYIVITTMLISDVNDTIWSRFESLLSAIERKRAAGFRFERNRYEFIAAHALKRLSISEATGREPSALEFDIQPGGKPVVAGGRGPHFSISHCDGLVACAISSNIPIGVDVEPLDRNIPLSAVNSIFATDEYAWLNTLTDDERARGIIALWTLKEAFVKSNGNGLSQELSGFSISFNPIRVTFSDTTNLDSTRWNFRQKTIAGRYLLGVSWQGRNKRVAYHNNAFLTYFRD